MRSTFTGTIPDRGVDQHSAQLPAGYGKLFIHYASNELGSITHVVDGRNVINHYEYDVWGNLAFCEETVSNRFLFTGQQYDGIIQQYYLRARFYNPVVARFTQEDTYRGDGQNLYTYCRNNPVCYVDPSGHCSKDPDGNQAGGGNDGELLLPSVIDTPQKQLPAVIDTPQKQLSAVINNYQNGISGPEANTPNNQNRTNSSEDGIDSSNPFYKQGGGSNLDDFMTLHARKHAYDPNTTSTKSKTQFGENIDVAKLREDTLLHPDKVIYNSEHNVIKYVKEYDFNISTPDTPTGSHRVFIELNSRARKTNRNSQFPYYGGKK